MSRGFNHFLRSRTGLILILAVLILVLALAIWFGIRPGAGTVLINDADAKCLPTCSVTDSRMLVLAGEGLETLAGDAIYVTLQSPNSAPTLQFGVFDGDTSLNWDYPFNGTLGVPSEFTLYADPNGDGSGTQQVGQWMGDTMANNAWSDFEVANNAAALNGSYYTYMLKVRNTDPNTISQNSFKLRTNGQTMVLSKDNAFGFIAAIWSLPDAQTVYPNWPDRSQTTYDGTFNFYMDVPDATTEIVVWDGDFDHGDKGCVINDTDDTDTPNSPYRPEWADNTDARPEEVAQTTFAPCVNGSVPTGSPPEDNNPAPVYLRSPSVQYVLQAPNGQSFTNEQPSGNKEWERFSIGSGTSQPVDVPMGPNVLLPNGLYEIQVSGLDMGNLNAWRLNQDALCVDASGNACEPVCIGDCGDNPVCTVQISHPDDPNNPGSGGWFYAEVLPSGDVYIRYTQSTNVNDNSYGPRDTRDASGVGPGMVGWGNKLHDYGKLLNSDQTRYEITDAAGNVVLDIYMDYISVDASAPSGYLSTGPSGSDGSVNVGQADWVYNWMTSQQQNMERFCNGTDCVVDGVDLSEVSPPTLGENDYTLVDPGIFGDWEFEYWVEFYVSAAAFSGSSFGGVELTDIHNSNAKMGDDQFCVGGGCGVCVPTEGGETIDFGAPPPAQAQSSAPEPPQNSDFQGCSAAFWAGNTDAWETFKKNDKANQVFGIDVPNRVQLRDLLAGDEGELMKEVTAALLNAAHSSVNYRYSLDTIQAYAFTSDEPGTIALLQAENSLTCPLN